MMNEPLYALQPPVQFAQRVLAGAGGNRRAQIVDLPALRPKRLALRAAERADLLLDCGEALALPATGDKPRDAPYETHVTCRPAPQRPSHALAPCFSRARNAARSRRRVRAALSRDFVCSRRSRSTWCCWRAACAACTAASRAAAFAARRRSRSRFVSAAAR